MGNCFNEIKVVTVSDPRGHKTINKWNYHREYHCT